MVEKTYHDLNAETNLFDGEGNTQLHKDKEAARAYFLEEINPNTVYFHNLEEKLNYLIEYDFYHEWYLDVFDFEDLKALYEYAYSYKFRFSTYLGALKFYTMYALRTNDGERVLERFEDRVVAVAVTLSEGDLEQAYKLVKWIIRGVYQPATPTFLNSARKNGGNLISCHIIRAEDNMESISKVITDSLQLSKRGAGIGILLTNLRENGAPIKGVEDRSSGVVPVMKLLEDSFSYSDQGGTRPGAGVVYLHANHPDIMRFLDTKRENADEKIRIKTLSTGVVVPDILFELAEKGEDMYTFSPYDVQRETGKAMSDVDITKHYYDFVENPEIRKGKISPRKLLQTIAELHYQSGYPFLVWEGNVNKNNPIDGWINTSNVCSEILQVNSPSTFLEDGTYDEVGRDISCNLGSLNIARTMHHFDEIEEIVDTAMRSLSAVTREANIKIAKSVENGNDLSRAVGLGQFNFHGYLMEQGLEYGSDESLEFIRGYMSTITFNALKSSMEQAKERGEVFYNFENSDYATGKYFDRHIAENYRPSTPEVKDLFSVWSNLPNARDWEKLRSEVVEHGIYNQNLQAIAPTGSISYVNHGTASIHPVASAVEIRKEGGVGRVYYPAYGLTEDNLKDYEDAYTIGTTKLIDTYAEFQKFVDQGQSMTMFVTDKTTTRDLVKAYGYAWRKGIKTVYYVRVQQDAIEGTEMEDCISCAI